MIQKHPCGWLKKFDWLIKEPIEPYNKKWNYDTCFAEAKKYKTRSEFNKKRSRAYDVARRNGWLADYTWMPDITAADSKVDSVYRYFFKEQNAVYVGLTNSLIKRDWQHHNSLDSSVNRFAVNNKIDIPIITNFSDIKSEMLDIEFRTTCCYAMIFDVNERKKIIESEYKNYPVQR